MSLPKTFKHFVFLMIAASVLAACGSVNRNSSPNYHINSMERKDAEPYCAKDKCHRQEPKDWNRDK